MVNKKVLIVILSNTKTHESKGRLANGLMMAKEMKEKGHTPKIIFDGAGVQSFAKIKHEDNDFHSLYSELKDVIVGGCSFCANAFGVKDELDESDLISEYHDHQSFVRYLEADYQIVNF